MIRPIDIRLNAAHPELPLVEAVTFIGSPSTVLIRGVPKAVGNWSITAVFVAASFPDGSTTTRAAVQSANGVWVATLPATATSGRTANGIRIMADGIDENGEAVTGYILGVADFAVASLDVTPAPEPGETSYQMLYFDEVPSTLRKGDMAKIDGVLKFYNGSAWEPFAAPVALDDAVTPTSANGVKSSGIWSAIWGALSALPTGFTSLYDWVVDQLAGKASKADATLDYRWEINPATSPSGYTYGVYWRESYQTWMLRVAPDEDRFLNIGFDAMSFSEEVDGITITGTRSLGYQLGSQSDKPLASEAEAEALRQGKQDALSAQQLANIAAVSDALAFDVTHSYGAGDPVVYNGTLYTFTATHTGAWTGSDVSAVDIIAMLAGKLGNSGEQTLDGTLNIQQIIGAGTPIPMRIEAGRIIMDAASVGESKINIPYKQATTDTLALLSDLDGKADISAIPYALGTPTVISTASSETVEGETVYYGAATLANRTANIVQVTAATALDELRITFPAATSGKVRDFGLRVEIGTGSAALAAPALVPIAPTGETIKIENADGTIPELADGTATAKGVTLLYFSENAPGVFVVKGEQVEEVA